MRWLPVWGSRRGVARVGCGRFVTWLDKVRPKRIGTERSDGCCPVLWRVMTYSIWQHRLLAGGTPLTRHMGQEDGLPGWWSTSREVAS